MTPTTAGVSGAHQPLALSRLSTSVAGVLSGASQHNTTLMLFCHEEGARLRSQTPTLSCWSTITGRLPEENAFGSSLSFLLRVESASSGSGSLLFEVFYVCCVKNILKILFLSCSWMFLYLCTAHRELVKFCNNKKTRVAPAG